MNKVSSLGMEKARLLIFTMFLMLTLLFHSCGGGGNDKSNSGSATYSVSLIWEPPTINDDGTPLTDLAGYKIYYGTSPGDYTRRIDVGIETTQFTVKGLKPGTYYFVVTAYNVTRNESGYSNEVSKEIK